MVFSVLSINRNSVWTSCFGECGLRSSQSGVFVYELIAPSTCTPIGIPFERMIKYHRLLASFCWVLCTLHMLTWQVHRVNGLPNRVGVATPPSCFAQVKWLREGTLGNNIVTLTNLSACTHLGTASTVYTPHFLSFIQ